MAFHIFLILNVIDLALTLEIVARTSVEAERAPIAHYLMVTYGAWGIVALKGLGLAWLCFFREWVSNRVFIVCNYVFVLIVLNNGYHLLKLAEV